MQKDGIGNGGRPAITDSKSVRKPWAECFGNEEVFRGKLKCSIYILLRESMSMFCEFSSDGFMWCHLPWFSLQHGPKSMGDDPGCVFPCTNQRKNMCLFRACHKGSTAAQPSGSHHPRLNISFIPCTNAAGALNSNTDPWLCLLSMSVIASTPTAIESWSVIVF